MHLHQVTSRQIILQCVIIVTVPVFYLASLAYSSSMKAAILLPPSPTIVDMELIGVELRNMRIMSLSGSFGSSPFPPASYMADTTLEPTGSQDHSPNVDHSVNGSVLPSPSSATVTTPAMSRLDVPTSMPYSPASTRQSSNFSDQ